MSPAPIEYWGVEELLEITAQKGNLFQRKEIKAEIHRVII